VALGSTPLPYRLDYTFETVSDFVTARLVVSARGEGWARSLDLLRMGIRRLGRDVGDDGISCVPLRGASTDLAARSGALDVDRCRRSSIRCPLRLAGGAD
jgi:hypothetical protein